jgi:hypothetical protein
MSDEPTDGHREPVEGVSTKAGAGISTDSTPERVGYKSPPVANQFKKGVSGNPAGRPKGRRSFKTELREVLDAKVVVTEGGHKSKVSTTHAMLLRLRQQALNGDVRAIDRLLLLAAAHLPAEAPTDLAALIREDQEIIDAYRRNLPPASDPDDH